MTVNDRNTILEAVDLLQVLGGNNGFCNLRPERKKIVLKTAKNLKDIVERDIKNSQSFQKVDFSGDVVYD
jgi:hypothetical protein